MMNLLAGFDQVSTQVKLSPDWKRWREEAFQVCQSQGLPTRREEAWKYTSVKTLQEKIFVPSLTIEQSEAPDLQQKLNKHLSPDFLNVVFVDGRLDLSLSSWRELSQETDLIPLSEVLSGRSAAAEGIFRSFEQVKARLPEMPSDVFENLNAAYLGQGLLLKIKKETKLKKPVQLLFVSHSEAQSTAVYPRLVVVLEERSQVVLMEKYVNIYDSESFQDSLFEILMSDSSRLEYVRTVAGNKQNLNLGRTRIFLQNQAALDSTSCCLSGRLSRHNLDLFLLGNGAVVKVHGLSMAGGTDVVDHHVHIDHIAGGNQTLQLYKGILNGESRVVFNGRVVIRAGAQKAHSEQLNHNLLLSSQAEVDSKPQLEIFADDVTATHGSTVGQLSDEELFYCESRGISQAQAEQLLSLGFLRDVVLRVDNPVVRQDLVTMVDGAYQNIKGLK